MSYEENNKVMLSGEVVREPEYSHEVMGEGFYEFTLSVKRLSGQCDFIPITISERLMDGINLLSGSFITVNGQFRSYNKQCDNKSKLMLTVFARSVEEFNEEINPNSIVLSGYICKEPMYRTTPFKREICDMLIAVNRAYNKSDYIPCIAWGRNARYVNTLKVGDRIELNGRIQSREYQKEEKGELVIKTAYEVSISFLKTDAREDIVLNMKRTTA